MSKLSSTSRIDCIYAVICAVIFSLSVLPGFSLIGNLFAQVAVTFVLSIIILIFVDFIIRIKPEVISYSLILMTAFWVLTAIIKQLILHIKAGDYSFKWLHIFYYDKPALIFVVLFTSILFYVISLLTKKNDSAYIDSYRLYIRNTLRCLLVYYGIILFYCFYLVREITFERSEPNLIPFEVISFSISRLDYELLFLLLGNISIFFPLGVIVSSVKPTIILNLILPIIISVCVEISQYFLGNGHPDIDDVILNVFGYYLGILVRIILDRIVYKASGKKFKSFILL